MSELTADRLREILRYDPTTGSFTWLKRSDARPSWNARYAGQVAGSKHQDKNKVYRVIKIDHIAFQAHRLAWLYMVGTWPEKLIDHHDGDGLNNKFGNLREATHAQNGANSKISKANTSGMKGVYFCKRTGKYSAVIRKNLTGHWLGRHDTAEAARAAYSTAAAKLHGEFANTDPAAEQRAHLHDAERIPDSPK